MNGNALNDFFNNLLVGFTQLGNWLFTPLVGGLTWTTPVILVSATGLIAFLTIAVIKWGLF